MISETRILELTEEEEAVARRRSRRDNRLGDIRTRLEEEEDDDPNSRPKRTCRLYMVPERQSLWKPLSARQGIRACPRAGAVVACRNSHPEERVRLCLDEGGRPVLPARSTACACALYRERNVSVSLPCRRSGLCGVTRTVVRTVRVATAVVPRREAFPAVVVVAASRVPASPRRDVHPLDSVRVRVR